MQRAGSTLNWTNFITGLYLVGQNVAEEETKLANSSTRWGTSLIKPVVSEQLILQGKHKLHSNVSWKPDFNLTSSYRK
jgi:hypothetical protein